MEQERNFQLPADIERESMRIIGEELARRGIVLPPERAAVVRRVIHTTADFDYADSLRFTESAVERAVEALRAGASIVTDTNMAKAGVSRAALSRLGGEVFCFMACPEAAQAAKARGITRAAVCMEKAAAERPGTALAVGNAPTALLKICELMEGGLRPAFVIAVPVGFVNVVESKERAFAACGQYGVPCIAAMGRKGGSNVAAATCNALLYAALEVTDPNRRQETLA